MNTIPAQVGRVGGCWNCTQGMHIIGGQRSSLRQCKVDHFSIAIDHCRQLYLKYECEYSTWNAYSNCILLCNFIYICICYMLSMHNLASINPQVFPQSNLTKQECQCHAVQGSDGTISLVMISLHNRHIMQWLFHVLDADPQPCMNPQVVQVMAVHALDWPGSVSVLSMKMKMPDNLLISPNSSCRSGLSGLWESWVRLNSTGLPWLLLGTRMWWLAMMWKRIKGSLMKAPHKGWTKKVSIRGWEWWEMSATFCTMSNPSPIAKLQCHGSMILFSCLPFSSLFFFFLPSWVMWLFHHKTSHDSITWPDHMMVTWSYHRTITWPDAIITLWLTST